MLINFHTIQKVKGDKYNLGDLVCSPFRYYDFSKFDTLELDLETPLEKYPKSADIIIGGGGIMLHPRIKPILDYFTGKKICWGVGDLGNSGWIGYLDLVSSREYRSGVEFVPCVTCKSKLFDQTYPICKHMVAYAGHKRPMRLDKKIKQLDTLVSSDAEFKDRITSLGAAGKQVITSSYHGAYWSLLLGKTTIFYAVGNLFKKYRTLKYWEPKEGMLQEFRTYNDQFYKKVISSLSS